MTLPPDITLITVTGTWLDWGGAPCSGSLTFSPTALTRTVDTAHSVAIMPERQTVQLDTTGSISVELIATDCPALVFAGSFLYTVAVNLSDSAGTPLAPYSFQLTLPAAGPSSVCVSTPQYAVNGASVTLPGN